MPIPVVFSSPIDLQIPDTPTVSSSDPEEMQRQLSLIYNALKKLQTAAGTELNRHRTYEEL